MKVHELVDFVSAEGELAGTAAAKFALGAAGQNQHACGTDSVRDHENLPFRSRENRGDERPKSETKKFSQAQKKGVKPLQTQAEEGTVVICTVCPMGCRVTVDADGILTTKTNMIRPAKDIGLVTVQRFFIVDSHSVDTAVESIRIAKPDVVEIMPGVVCKKIREFSDKVRNTPILAGGLIEFKEDVDNAIEAGATAVSTANRQLWDYR